MGDVERIGDVAQKLTDLPRLAAHHFASGPDGYDQREDQENDDRLVESVYPKVLRFGPADTRHCQTGDDNECAPPKPSSDGDMLSHAAMQEAREERKKQACEPDVELRRVDAPTADDGVGGIVALGEYAKGVHVERQGEREEGKESYANPSRVVRMGY